MTAQTRLPFELDQRAETGAADRPWRGAAADRGVPDQRRCGGAGRARGDQAAPARSAPSALVEGLFACGPPAASAARTWRRCARTRRWRCCSGTACRRRRPRGTFSRRSTRRRRRCGRASGAAVPGEGERLQGLAQANRRLVGLAAGAGAAGGGDDRRRRDHPREPQAAARWRPTTGAPATSRWSRCGPSRTWSWPTSSATATCRPAPATGGWSSARVAALPPGVGRDPAARRQRALRARAAALAGCARASATRSAPT